MHSVEANHEIMLRCLIKKEHDSVSLITNTHTHTETYQPYFYV